ncbi:MAG: YigZ family protein [Lachnospiraceae bacterium]|nr:YigZ family protein [Lachnospiraceae bacterium]
MGEQTIPRGVGRPSYLTVSEPGMGEITEKKSRFIAGVYPVHDAGEAEEILRDVRKRYWDAKHHCHAFALGAGREITRCSDDGEPSGTAGKPILEVLTGAGFTDTLIVVTRYFGGVLLGTGGLVRAYTRAAQEGLAQTPFVRMCYGNKITVDIDYSFEASFRRYLREHNLIADDIQYAERVTAAVYIIADDIESFCADITQLTEGRAGLSRGEAGYFRQQAG